MHKKIKLHTTILLLLLVNAVFSSADTLLVFKGKLGNEKIAMELNKTPKGYEGVRYCYIKYGANIPLNGEPNTMYEAFPVSRENAESSSVDDNFTFIDPHLKKARIVWHGKLTEQTYSGIWENLKNRKSLAFKLQKVASYDSEKELKPNEDYISMQSHPYDYLRTQVPLNIGKEIIRGKVAYRMVTDPRTGQSFPRLTRHPNRKVMAKVNHLLEQEFWSYNLGTLDDKDFIYMDSSCSECGSNFTETIDYLSTTLLSISIFTEGNYIDSPHPYDQYFVSNYDLIRGENLDINRLFYTWKSKDKDLNTSERIDPKLSEFLAKRINLIKSKQKDKDYDFTCLDAIKDDDFKFKLGFSKPNKLTVNITYYPNAVLKCCMGSQLEFKFNELRPILKQAAKAYLYPAH